MNTILTDLIPAKARKYVYAVLFLVAFGYGLWQANDGDWKQVIAAALPVLVGALAVSNTDTAPEPPALGADEDGFGGDAPEPADPPHFD